MEELAPGGGHGNPEDLPDPAIEPGSPPLQVDLYQPSLIIKGRVSDKDLIRIRCWPAFLQSRDHLASDALLVYESGGY